MYRSQRTINCHVADSKGDHILKKKRMHKYPQLLIDNRWIKKTPRTRSNTVWKPKGSNYFPVKNDISEEGLA